MDAYNDSNVDFHQIVAEMADIPRSQAKTINLGSFYGMGKNKLQAELGINKEKADILFKQYHSRVPFVKQLMDNVSSRADRDRYVPCWVDYADLFMGTKSVSAHKALPHEAALQEHGPGIRRAHIQL